MNMNINSEIKVPLGAECADRLARALTAAAAECNSDEWELAGNIRAAAADLGRANKNRDGLFVVLPLLSLALVMAELEEAFLTTGRGID